MKPDETKMIVHGNRHASRVAYLKKFVDVVAIDTMSCPFKGFGSSNSFVLLLARKKKDIKYPPSKAVPNSIVSMSQPFFHSVELAIDQYERLEKEMGSIIDNDICTRKLRQTRTVSRSPTMNPVPVKTIVPQIPTPVKSQALKPTQLPPLRITLAYQNQAMDPYWQGIIFTLLEYNGNKHRERCSEVINDVSCPQVLGGMLYFTEISAYLLGHAGDRLPLPAVTFGSLLISAFKPSIGSFGPRRVMLQQNIEELKSLIFEIWQFAILSLQCFKGTGRYAGAVGVVEQGIVEYMRHLDSTSNTLKRHEEFLKELQDGFCYGD